MLYNPKLNTILWTPFKNFSTSLAEYFDVTEPRPSNPQVKPLKKTHWEFYMSNNPASSLYHIGATRHSVIYPLENRGWSTFKRILVLRHPYDRVLSMWKFHAGHPQWSGETFDYYLRNIFMFHPYTYPACRTFRGHYDEVIKVENINEELEKHGLLCDKPFPHVNRSSPNGYRLTKKDKLIIENFHHEDFNAGGYDA
jgi:hypothetical protein